MNAPSALAVPPVVVTATVCAPIMPAGVTAVMEVALTTTTLVAGLPPTVTLLAPVKLVPVMVIGVPPLNNPEFGLTLEMVGAATYVNVIACDVDPPAVVTTMVFAPAAPAGVTAVMEVALTTTTLVAGLPPTVTLLAPVKLLPVIVMAVPPKVVPEVGETLEIVGAGIARKPMLARVASLAGPTPAAAVALTV